MAAKLKKPQTFDDLCDGAFVRERDLIESVLPFSRATLWRRVRDGDFPAPVNLGKRITAWKVGEVRRFLSEASLV